MDANQERKQRGQAKSSSAPADKPLGTGARTIITLTLAFNAIAISLYAFFGTGDEVTCGSGISANVCYLPGVAWLGYVLLATWIMTAFSFMLMKPDSK